MTDDARLIPGSVRDERALAFAAGMARHDEIDLVGMLAYLVDHAPAALLPHLAQDLSLGPDEGWALAVTEAEQRALLKRAWELHAYKGTPWSIEAALAAAGFGGAQISERSGIHFADGSVMADGTEDAGPIAGGWALYRVRVALGEDKGLSADLADLVARTIKAFAPKRSHLERLSFTVGDLVDAAPATEAITTRVAFGNFREEASGCPMADGSLDADGGTDAAGRQDRLTYRIRRVSDGAVLEEVAA